MASKYLSHAFYTPQPLPEIRQHVAENVSPMLAQSGYKLRVQHDTGFTFVNDYWPGWVILVCIFLFPFGLLALLSGKNERVLNVRLSPDSASLPGLRAPDRVGEPVCSLQAAAAAG